MSNSLKIMTNGWKSASLCITDVLRIVLLSGTFFVGGCLMPGFDTETAYQSSPQARPSMTASEARNWLVACLQWKRGPDSWTYRDIQISDTGVSYVDPRGPTPHSWRFAEVGTIAVTYDAFDPSTLAVNVPGDRFVFGDLPSAKRCVDVVCTLGYYSAHPGAELSDDAAPFAAFQRQAEAWRALPSQPALPEEARRYEVLAKNAIQKKDFDAAVGYYAQGLTVCPLWPEAQYNAAVICGELGQYAEGRLPHEAISRASPVCQRC